MKNWESVNKCPTCGKEIDKRAESRFCIYCGADLASQEVERECPFCGALASRTEETCPECGKDLDGTLRIECPNCHAPLQSGAKSCPACGWRRERPPRRTALVVTCAIIAIAAIAVAAVLLMQPQTESYTVFYRCDGSDIADPKTVSGVEPGTSVTEQALEIEGYTIADQGSSQTISVKRGGNNAVLFTYDKIEPSPEPEPKPETITGVWYLVRGDAPSLDEGNVSDMWDFGLGSSLTIDADGTGSLALSGKTIQFGWRERGESELEVRINGSDCRIASEGNTLVLSGYVSGNLYFSEGSPEIKHEDFVLTDSDSRPYSTSELEALTDYELCLARNELFIRNGRKVESEQIAKHYSGLGLGGADASIASLSPIENTNLMTITRIEWSRDSIYRNMLSTSRRDCYLAYSEELDELASDGSIALAQLVDFDKSDETFEELLVVITNGATDKVELYGYSNGAVVLERSDTLEKQECLALEEYDNGYSLVSGSRDLDWRNGEGELVSATCYQVHPGLDYPFSYASNKAVNVGAEGSETLTNETAATLKADYCDYSSFYGVWLPAVSNADEAWKECKELQALGFDAWKVQPKGWDGLDGEKDTYMVTAGRFNTKAEAREAAERLKELDYSNVSESYSGTYHDFQ